jgi:hypothetical protein
MISTNIFVKEFEINELKEFNFSENDMMKLISECGYNFRENRGRMLCFTKHVDFMRNSLRPDLNVLPSQGQLVFRLTSEVSGFLVVVGVFNLIVWFVVLFNLWNGEGTLLNLLPVDYSNEFGGISPFHYLLIFQPIVFFGFYYLSRRNYMEIVKSDFYKIRNKIIVFAQHIDK